MRKVFLLLFVSLCFGLISFVLCPGQASAQPFPGGLPACQEALNTCDADLETCEADLETCEAEAQVFPGDGYPNPDAFGVSGHGTALSYTDNGDGTFTDNNTGFMWEKKLAADGSDGGNCNDPDQADRIVHCVNNTYTWTDGGDSDFTDPDGTLFTEFLAELNNSAFAGFNDWCIPNVKKLQSIVNYSTCNGCSEGTAASSVPGETAASFFPGETAVPFYWSATTIAFNAGFAWLVGFEDGNVLFDTKGSNGHARAVRPCL